ncbi:MOR1B protein, partial [Podilymbus podiceps]|nr:MOR1B protein [Podilymbus podiceps]
VGNSFVLTCSPKSNITMVTWKISPKVGGSCTLGYRADKNETDRTNCSDSMNWKYRPDQDPALDIRQVGIAHEGNYTCEVVSTDGNFQQMYHLTVLGKALLPHFTISWVLEGNSTPKEESHGNGTVTVLSKFTAHSTNVTHTTCFVSHPAVNWSRSIAC